VTAAALVPSVRSRLLASGTSFILGFATANVGILLIPRPDQWVWIAVAVVLMLTGVVGVLLADSPRPVSIWAVLGVELFLVFTLVPLLWTFTVATVPEGSTAVNLWPDAVSWGAFSDVLDSGVARQAAGTSLLVAGLATLVSMPLAVAAAYALVRVPTRGRRLAYALVVAVLLVPVVALATPMTDQLLALDLGRSRLALVVPALVVTLPLAIWLSVTALRDVPWALHDAMRADGADRRQRLRHFALPLVAPELLVVALLVLVAGCGDFVLGAALASDQSTRPLPATLLLAGGDVERMSTTAAATGLLWLVPVLVLLLAFPRRIGHLLGRSPR
jgi:multiple sugar transport system permease protein